MKFGQKFSGKYAKFVSFDFCQYVENELSFTFQCNSLHASVERTFFKNKFDVLPFPSATGSGYNVL